MDLKYDVSGLAQVQRRTNVSSITAPGTLQYTHAYTSRDLTGRLLTAEIKMEGHTAHAFTYAYDKLGRRMEINAPSWQHLVDTTAGYDAVGNLNKYDVIEWGGTATSTYENEYSDLYQLTRHQGTSSVGASLFDSQYSYDSIANRLSGPSAFDANYSSYIYNDLNELMAVQQAGKLGNTIQLPVKGFVQPNPLTASSIHSITVQLGSTTVNATSSGSDWTVNGGTIAVPTDGADHTITVTATAQDGRQTTKTVTVNIDTAASKAMVYDLNGNLLQQSVYLASGSVETTTYTYDALDRLRHVVPPSGGSVTYSYDAQHRRVSKEVESLTFNTSTRVYYLWSGMSEVGAFDASGNLLQFRTLGSGMGLDVGAAVGVELRANAASAWKTYIPIHNHRGDVVAMLNGNGSVAESYRYDAYGNVKIYDHTKLPTTNSKLGNPWTFSSKRYEDETRLFYFTRRYYDPSVGRFITTDPAGFSDGPNLYGYVGGNPANFVDPDGRLSKGVGNSIAKGVNRSGLGDLVQGAWGALPSPIRGIGWTLAGHGFEALYSPYRGLSNVREHFGDEGWGVLNPFRSIFAGYTLGDAVLDSLRVLGGLPISFGSGDFLDVQSPFSMSFDDGNLLVTYNGILNNSVGAGRMNSLSMKAMGVTDSTHVQNRTFLFGLGDLVVQILGNEFGLVDITAIRGAWAIRGAAQLGGDINVIAHSQGTMTFFRSMNLVDNVKVRSRINYQGFGPEKFISASSLGLGSASNSWNVRPNNGMFSGYDRIPLTNYLPVPAKLCGLPFLMPNYGDWNVQSSAFNSTVKGMQGNMHSFVYYASMIRR